ncbi:hypothetical protein T492DRAFT_981843 [Pavlovales sp. CCMP2436]|nr:hypothetical protein T492DRAFT_981843 [Pavlovales sp. CCMP2436]
MAASQLERSLVSLGTQRLVARALHNCGSKTRRRRACHAAKGSGASTRVAAGSSSLPWRARRARPMTSASTRRQSSRRRMSVSPTSSISCSTRWWWTRRSQRSARSLPTAACAARTAAPAQARRLPSARSTCVRSSYKFTGAKSSQAFDGPEAVVADIVCRRLQAWSKARPAATAEAVRPCKLPSALSFRCCRAGRRRRARWSSKACSARTRSAFIFDRCSPELCGAGRQVVATRRMTKG